LRPPAGKKHFLAQIPFHLSGTPFFELDDIPSAHRGQMSSFWVLGDKARSITENHLWPSPRFAMQGEAD
jgi:hypothetical protein